MIVKARNRRHLGGRDRDIGYHDGPAAGLYSLFGTLEDIPSSIFWTSAPGLVDFADLMPRT